MGFGGSFRLIRSGVVWRTLGLTDAGEILLDAMAGDDEQERRLAGMALVKAGERSAELIEEAVASGRATPPLVRLLADIGGARCRSLLGEIAERPGELREAAIESLGLLERIDALEPEDESEKL